MNEIDTKKLGEVLGNYFAISYPPAELYYLFFACVFFVFLLMTLLMIYVAELKLKKRLSACISYSTIISLCFIYLNLALLGRCDTQMKQIHSILLLTPALFITVSCLLYFVDRKLFNFCHLPHWANITLMSTTMVIMFYLFMSLFSQSACGIGNGISAPF